MSNPLDLRPAVAGSGFFTRANCIQCQKPCPIYSKRGKAKAGSLRGMTGLMCEACRVANAQKVAA